MESDERKRESVERKTRSTVTLNIECFVEERAQLDEQRETLFFHLAFCFTRHSRPAHNRGRLLHCQGSLRGLHAHE